MQLRRPPEYANSARVRRFGCQNGCQPFKAADAMSRGLLTVHPRLKFGRHLQSSRIESTDFHLTRTVSITRDHSVSFSSQKRFSTWRLQIARDTDSLITTVLEQLDVASRFNVANTSSSDGRATALVPSRRGSWPPASRRWVKTNCSRASSWRPRLRYTDHTGPAHASFDVQRVPQMATRANL